MATPLPVASFGVIVRLCLLLAMGLTVVAVGLAVTGGGVSRLYPIVQSDGGHEQWGFMTAAGRDAVPPQFDEVVGASSPTTIAGVWGDGLAAVRNGTKYGYVDRSGLLVLPDRWMQALPFSEGLALVQQDRKWGVIDRHGRTVVEPVWDMAMLTQGRYVGGLVPVGQRDGDLGFKTRWGYADTTGAWAVPPRFTAAQSFSEGLALVQDDGAWHYITRDGSPAFAGTWTRARRFSGGLAAVEVDGKWGYLTADGTLRIPATFTAAYDFNDGLAAVQIDGKYGYIGIDGAVVIAPRFSRCRAFSEGMAPACEGLDWGYIDRHGTMVITPAWDEAGPFMGGRAPVWRLGTGSDAGLRLGWITPAGAYVRNPRR